MAWRGQVFDQEGQRVDAPLATLNVLDLVAGDQVCQRSRIDTEDAGRVDMTNLKLSLHFLFNARD
ncbi:hypothetical protein [Labrenzia sp. OB1]|uniref:hypothetical protein n=1 Tax=Labrenzia sp. OB1 TaxID=1561204 RepID=UPI0007B267C8|nr:hypothetical protein [Labrenzia sp. OB1]KZM42916.1 hypothetical protein OA90_27235 [Labrenzia sp. OB1]